MRFSIQQLAETSQPFDTLLVGGAGAAGTLDALRRLRARRTVLVEPIPSMTESIRLLSGEEVWQVALTAGEAGQATMYLVSQMQHSSLRQPAALFDYFPRLKPAGAIGVATRSLSEAIDQLAMESIESNLLALDVPGMINDLVESVDDLRLRRFSDVVLRGSEEPLYDGERTIDAAVERLGRAGFEEVQDDPEEVYPYRTVRMVRKGAATTRMSDTSDASSEAEYAQLKPNADDLVVQLDNLQREYNEHRTRADEVNGALTCERNALSLTLTETETRCQHLAGERDRYAARAADLEKEVHRLRDEKLRLDNEMRQANRTLDAEKARADSAEAALAESVRACDALQANLKAQEGANLICRNEVESLKAKVVELNRGLAEALTSAGLSTRLQTLRENDLVELQQRYAAIHDAYQKQQGLLDKLSTRLVAANEYFQRLARSADVSAGSSGIELVTDQSTGRAAQKRKVPGVAASKPSRTGGKRERR